MRDHIQGRPFHGEFSSADASALSEANSRFTLFDTSKHTIALAANERVVITDIFVLTVDAMILSIYDGADTTVSAGEKIATASLDPNGGFVHPFQTPHYCTKGTYPKCKSTAAGSFEACIHGVIEKT